MEKINISKHPSLAVISETEPSSYNAQRTNYHSHNPPHVHVQLPDSRMYKKTTIRPSPTNDGHINQGYAGNSQTNINRESSTPSVGGYVFRI